ncbi:hypothetical protein PQX77_004312 [Marasmius sp. AFHP31]|nr:hypothetical protein PQX77_004312 [Marasmius sp. AFHP31]
MLSTPTSVTLGLSRADDAAVRLFPGFDSEHAHMDIVPIFETMAHFTNLTSLAVCKISFPVSELLSLLRHVPCLLELFLNGTANNNPSPGTPRAIDKLAIPPSLSSLSLRGMARASLSGEGWETLVVLANAPTLQCFEIDVTTWNPFYDAWLSRVVEGWPYQALCLHYHAFSNNGEPAVLSTSSSLKRFALLPGRDRRTYLFSTLERYLCDKAKNMTSLCIAPHRHKRTTPHTPSMLNLKFRRLVEFEGAPEDFRVFDDLFTLEWRTITFMGEGGFQILDSTRRSSLTKLCIVLEDDRDLPFLLGGCPRLTTLEVALRKDRPPQPELPHMRATGILLVSSTEVGVLEVSQYVGGTVHLLDMGISHTLLNEARAIHTYR